MVHLPGDPLQEVRRQPRQRMGYLPVSFNMDGDESIWIHAVSVGEVLTARPLISDLQRRYPHLRMFLSTTTMAGQQLARRNVPGRRRGVLLSVRPRLLRPPHARSRAAEALHHDGDRDLAEPAARVPRRGDQDGGRQRPPLAAIVPALPDDSRPFMRRVLDDIDAFCVQSEESARRFIDLGANPGRVVGHRQPEVRFARPAGVRALQARARDRVLRYFRVPASRPVHRRRQHDEGRRGRRAARLPPRARDVAEHAAGPGAAPSRALRRSRAAGRQEGCKTVRAIGPGHRRRAARRRRHARHASASWRRSIRSPPSCSSAAASSRPAATTSSSRRCSASRSCSARTWTNFVEIAEAFRHQRRRRAADAASASSTKRCVSLMSDPVRRARLGAAARALVEANRGAKDKSVDGARRAAAAGAARLSRQRQAVPTHCLIPSTGRSMRARRRRWFERHPQRRRRLRQPVISVGNLTSVAPARRRWSRASREWLLDARRAPADPQPRLRPRRSARRRRRRLGRQTRAAPTSRTPAMSR